MIDFTPLENPVWSSLTSAHRSLARIHGLAARYPSDISPLSGLQEFTPAAFDDLRALTEPHEIIGLVTAEPVGVPADWEIVLSRMIDQMVCEDLKPSSSIAPLLLSDADVPDMLALTAETQPGPFAARTIRMGKYIGVRSGGGQLMAMAGQRLSLDGFREISAVCTSPAHQGKGYAGRLMSLLAREIAAEGKMPFLHVKTENAFAKALYAKLGFRLRRAMHFNVIRPR